MNEYVISKGGSGLPSRVILHAVEGFGKTSFGANAPKPLFCMTRQENGLLTLIDNGRIPETDHMPEAASWFHVLRQVDYATNAPDVTHKAFVLDTLTGAAKLCEEHVVGSMYKGELESYNSFGKGPEASAIEFGRLFAKLDELRVKKRMGIVLLAHTSVKTFKNPEGEDYDRYIPEMHDKLWRVAAKWADVILFGNFETVAKKERGKLKAKGASTGRRLLFTRRTAAWDAKERVGLSQQIELPNDPAFSFKAYQEAVRAAKTQKEVAEPIEPVTTPIEEVQEFVAA